MKLKKIDYQQIKGNISKFVSILTKIVDLLIKIVSLINSLSNK